MLAEVILLIKQIVCTFILKTVHKYWLSTERIVHFGHTTKMYF